MFIPREEVISDVGTKVGKSDVVVHGRSDAVSVGKLLGFDVIVGREDAVGKADGC